MALALLDTMRPTRRPVSTSSTRSTRPDPADRSPQGSLSVNVEHVDAGGRIGGGRGDGGLGGESGRDRPNVRGSGPRADVFTWSGAMTACIEGGCSERVVEMIEVRGQRFVFCFRGRTGKMRTFALERRIELPVGDRGGVLVETGEGGSGGEGEKGERQQVREGPPGEPKISMRQ